MCQICQICQPSYQAISHVATWCCVTLCHLVSPCVITAETTDHAGFVTPGTPATSLVLAAEAAKAGA